MVLKCLYKGVAYISDEYEDPLVDGRYLPSREPRSGAKVVSLYSMISAFQTSTTSPVLQRLDVTSDHSRDVGLL